MNAAAPNPTPALVPPAWQRLVLVSVRGQKLRHRDPQTFAATTARLVAYVTRGTG